MLPNRHELYIWNAGAHNESYFFEAHIARLLNICLWNTHTFRRCCQPSLRIDSISSRNETYSKCFIFRNIVDDSVRLLQFLWKLWAILLFLLLILFSSLISFLQMYVWKMWDVKCRKKSFLNGTVKKWDKEE